MSIFQLTQVDIAVYGAVAALLPILIAVINKPTFPDWARQVVMFVVALVAGAVAYFLKNGWAIHDTAGFVAALLGVWAATQAAYLLFWKHAIGPVIEQNVLGGKRDANSSRDGDGVLAPDVDHVEPGDPYYDAQIPVGKQGPAETDPSAPLDEPTQGKQL